MKNRKKIATYFNVGMHR